MFDCGEGSQVQLMKSAVRPGRITKIFITHLHGDHVFGLPGLLCTISAGANEDATPLELYGPVGLRQMLRTVLNLARSQLQFRYTVHELHHDIHPGDYDGMTEWCPSYEATGQLHFREVEGDNIFKNPDGYWDVCRDGSLCVRANTLVHRVACFGFVITEDPLPGRLLVDKLKALGIPPGPLYAKLKKGETVVSSDGIKVSSAEVVGPCRRGRKVVILGDTCDSSSMIPITNEADVLVHEATNENSHEEKCRENGHSTPAMAAAFCHSIRARKLILTHFSQRYKKVGDDLKPGEQSIEVLEREASEELTRIDPTLTVDVSCAEDLKVYAIAAKTDMLPL